jgi:FkbM family methyltransferase
MVTGMGIMGRRESMGMGIMQRRGSDTMIKKRIISLLSVFIAKNHRRWLLKYLYVAARFFIVSAENKNPDFMANGENWLWGRLASLDMDCVFDVGANVGDWSIGASKKLKTKKIYAFEPIPHTYNLLINNIGNLEIYPQKIAISDFTGELEMNFSIEKSYLSSSISNADNTSFQKANCKVQRGDEFCNIFNIGVIDFLKIDTEGNDFKVLKGFENKIKSNEIRLIQFEYGPFSIVSKDLLKDFYVFLNQYGYVIGKIYPNHIDLREYHVHSENFILSNFIAIKKDDIEIQQLLS